MRKILPIISLLIIVVFLFSGCANKAANLTEDEQKAYEILKWASYEFDTPQSVRIVSGMIEKAYDEEYKEYDYFLYGRLLSANYYGTLTTQNYLIKYYCDEGQWQFRIINIDDGVKELQEYRDNYIDTKSTPYNYLKIWEEAYNQYNKSMDDLYNPMYKKSKTVTSALNYGTINELLREQWEFLNLDEKEKNIWTRIGISK